MEIKRINLIGFGNVGQALYQQLFNKVEIVDVYKRSSNTLLSEKFNISFVEKINELSAEVDLNIIAVPDIVIPDIILDLNKDVNVVHTSGGVAKEVFHGFTFFGILYPLQTFTKGIDVDFSAIPFFLEANADQFATALSNFTKSYLSKVVHFADSETRKHIHLSAVVTSNFLTYFLGVADSILGEKNVSIDILNALLTETLRKCVASGPEVSLTGPAARGDIKLLNEYTEMLSDSEFKEVFSIINSKISKKDFTVL